MATSVVMRGPAYKATATARPSRARCVVPKATYSDYQSQQASSHRGNVVSHAAGTAPLEEAQGNGLLDWIHNLSAGLFEEDARAEDEWLESFSQSVSSIDGAYVPRKCRHAMYHSHIAEHMAQQNNQRH